MTGRLADFGIAAADFDGIAADALDDEVLDNTPRLPAAGRHPVHPHRRPRRHRSGPGGRPAYPAPRAGTGREMMNPSGPVIRQVVKAGGAAGLTTEPMRADSMRSHR